MADPKRLTKGHDKKLGGVASGLADYFEIDPTLVRVLWVVALFVGPLGMGAALAYVILWVVMPVPEGTPPVGASPSGSGMDPAMLLGVVIVAVGALLLLRSSWFWMPFGAFGLQVFWPVLLIALGAFIIYSARQRA